MDELHSPTPHQFLSGPNRQFLQLLEAEMRFTKIGLIYLDIIHFSKIEQHFGNVICNRIITKIEELLAEIQDTFPDIIFSYRTLGDDFFIYVRINEDSSTTDELNLKKQANQIYIHIKHRLMKLFPQLKDPVDFHISFIPLQQKLNRNLESIVYSAIKKALRHAKLIHNESLNLHQDEFQEIIAQQKITTHLQPIVSLSLGSILGYEALTRGPEKSYFYNPVNLFNFAEAEGFLYTFEKMCRELAIERGSTRINSQQKLFLNINSQVVHDPDFTPGHTLSILQKYQLSPKNIVFEITERSAIEDFESFKRVLEHYRKQGFLIAVDDAGAGYSSLQTISELKPDFIKIDRSLIEGIEKNKVKENILESFVSFARKMNSKIIAEGIETVEELAKVIRLGVHYGQGFLLARPAYPPHDINHEAIDTIERHKRLENMSLSKMSIREITSPVKFFHSGTLTSLVFQYFNQVHWDLGVVITKNKIPYGLVMKSKLNQVLATQYGVSLYRKQPIDKICDTSALVVESNTSIDLVAQMAIARDPDQIYDLVIVVENGELLGAVSIQTILDYFANVKLEMERVANPLTGLPGNTQINKIINHRLSSGETFSLIYADLDHFKWYNDQFGFQRGDQVIKHVASILQQIIVKNGDPYDFVGHIGGDDFVIISSLEKGESISHKIIKTFNKEMNKLYDSPEEMFTHILDRQGRTIPHHGLSISLALIECHTTAGLELDKLSYLSAMVKKEAKKINESSLSIYKYQTP